ncbi:MAG: carbohydrate ABC transporter permease [Chloroflexota bacterium]
MSVRMGHYLGKSWHSIAIFLILFFNLFPIIWIALTAFKTDRYMFTSDLVFPPTLSNFSTIFSSPLNFGPLVVNSVVVALGTIAIAIPVALTAAYVFSRHTFVGSTALLVWILSTQFIPGIVVAIPYFNLFRTIGLLDTRLGLIIVELSAVVPYAIWMIKGFIDGLPREVEEAARIDGCSELGIVRHVTLPLAVPGIAVATVFALVATWNDFMFPLILTHQNAETLQIGLMSTVSATGIQWNWMSATGLVIMVPIFILSYLIRNYFVQGLTMGAVK